MQVPLDAGLTDGVVTLRPLSPGDATAHLAGEDHELVRWLNGGPGTPQSVRAHIERARRMWAAGGPILTFGIRLVAGDVLTGTVEAQLGQPFTSPDQANLAFGLYPIWRGQGLATRAVLLATRFLAERTSIEQAVIRVHPANRPSSAVARRAGFRPLGTITEDSGEYNWFVQGLRTRGP